MTPRDELPAVLYVDAELLHLRVFEANFKGHFRVVTCASAAQALELLGAMGDVAVLVADQRVRELDGVQLLERVREKHPDVQRMLLTPHSYLPSGTQAVGRGLVNRYFVKPWNKEELLGALRDAAEIHRLQLKLRELEARLAGSERFAVLGQVSAGISHELMNPVSYMCQNVATLKEELSTLSRFAQRQRPDEVVQRVLDDLPNILQDIEAGARHVRELALSVRTQARGEDPQSSSDLREVVSFAIKLARAELRQRARLVLDGAPVQVRGGPVKLCQVILNLVVNAAHAMEGVSRPGLITVRWAPEAERVRLDVQDNGVGIPPELQERVFEPLFTTKPVGMGSGLGLAISRDIVRDLGGDIQLHSRPGEGTTVTLLLKSA